jgi:hypothetical protein
VQRSNRLVSTGRTHTRTEQRRIGELADIEPLHVAAYIEALQATAAKPTVKQHLAAIRMLFDWLIIGQVLAINPAHAVRGPKHVIKRGKTPVLTEDQARRLLESIDTSSLVGLRDRALIGVMIYTFARVGAVVGMGPQRRARPGRCASSGLRVPNSKTWSDFGSHMGCPFGRGQSRRRSAPAMCSRRPSPRHPGAGAIRRRPRPSSLAYRP